MSEIEEPIGEEPVAKALPVEVVAELEKVGIAAATEAELADVKAKADALPVVQAELADKTALLAAEVAAKQAALAELAKSALTPVLAAKAEAQALLAVRLAYLDGLHRDVLNGKTVEIAPWIVGGG